jgi:hypothetical protein
VKKLEFLVTVTLARQARRGPAGKNAGGMMIGGGLSESFTPDFTPERQGY